MTTDDELQALVMERRGREFAFESLDPARTAHLVVDMQNVFVSDSGAAAVPGAPAIIPAINQINLQVRRAGGTVVFLQNTWGAEALATWSNYFDFFWTPAKREELVASMAAEADGHKLSAELVVEPEDIIVHKTRFSAFVPGSSDLDAMLRARGIDTLIITGVLTDVCCESTARDAAMMNYRVLFVADATATYDVESQLSSQRVLKRSFCDVVDTGRVLFLLARK